MRDVLCGGQAAPQKASSKINGIILGGKGCLHFYLRTHNTKHQHDEPTASYAPRPAAPKQTPTQLDDDKLCSMARR